MTLRISGVRARVLAPANVLAIASVLGLGATLGGCGYSIAGASRAPLAVDIGPVEERGIDVDAAALVGASLRRTIARGPGTVLTSGPDAARLEVELVATGASLQPFAEPSVRAAQYQEIVELRGRLVDASGTEVWRSELVRGEAQYLSEPGAIERLDGARRRALGRAVDVAVERLVASLRWRE